MQILVTGGAGFIGSHLVGALVEQGHSVRVLDNFSTGKRQNLAGLEVELMDGEVTDFEMVCRAVAGCEQVFHLAALVSVSRSVAEPMLNHQVNVTGMFQVLEACRLAGARRLVYASSAAVYGNLPQLPKREDDPLAPVSPYGVAKWMNEQVAGIYTTNYALETVGLRYFNVFGQRQDPTSPYSGVLSIFCRAVLQGEVCTILGDGEQSRDFVHVSDVVQANLRAMKAELPNKQLICNVGRGEQTSLNQILTLLGEIMGYPIPVRYQPERAGDIRHSLSEISRARAQLGYEPQIGLAEGLEATLAWLATGR